MFNRLLELCILVFLIGLLSGCAGAPVQQQGTMPGMRSPTGVPQAMVESKETVVYKIPISSELIYGRSKFASAIEFHDPLKGIGFANKTLSRNAVDMPHTWGKVTTESLDCATIDVARKMLLCTKSRELVLNTSGNAKWYAYSRFYINISVDEKPDQYVVTFLPTIKEAKNDRSLSNSVSAPTFPESEILDLLGQGCFRIRLEVDSQYGKDSVFSNFRRLLGGSRPARGSGEDVKNQHVFQMKRDGYQAELTVEIWPYRAGSKTTVTAVVTVQPTSVEQGVSRTVDVRKIMEDVRKDVANVVNS